MGPESAKFDATLTNICPESTEIGPESPDVGVNFVKMLAPNSAKQARKRTKLVCVCVCVFDVAGAVVSHVAC